jgi:hypothetical protein
MQCLGLASTARGSLHHGMALLYMSTRVQPGRHRGVCVVGAQQGRTGEGAGAHRPLHQPIHPSCTHGPALARQLPHPALISFAHPCSCLALAGGGTMSAVCANVQVCAHAVGRTTGRRIPFVVCPKAPPPHMPHAAGVRAPPLHAPPPPRAPPSFSPSDRLGPW